MDFRAAEAAFRQLEQMRQSGQIDIDAYRQQLAQVRVIDQSGRTWMIQEQTGQWFAWDGGQWQPGVPSAPAVASENSDATASPTIAQQSRLVEASYAAGQHRAGSVTEQIMPASNQRAISGSHAPQSGYGTSDGFAMSGQTSQGAYATGATGYAAPSAPVKYFRPGCATVTFRMFLWALLWCGAAWIASTWIQATPWWIYVLVLGGALATMILVVRKLTRHGRARRAQVTGGAR